MFVGKEEGRGRGRGRGRGKRKRVKRRREEALISLQPTPRHHVLDY
jgi:hypothetical protein